MVGKVEIVEALGERAVLLPSLIAARLGVACGRACFNSAQAEEFSRRSEPVILVRRDTSTEDVAGFALADGIWTAIGGRTSHAAVVARQMGKVCLVGCRTLTIDADELGANLGGEKLRPGDWIALDGANGAISRGRRDIVMENPPECAIIRQWKDEARQSVSA